MSLLIGLAALSGAVLFESAKDVVYRMECNQEGCSGPVLKAGDENWGEYRLEVEILPGEGFAGFDFHVQNDGWSGGNVHFLGWEPEIQPGVVYGGKVTAWKLWPYGIAHRPSRKGEWVKLRIDTGAGAANIYINDEEKPAVTMHALPFSRGGVRAWAFAGSPSFRNLRVTALGPGSVKPLLADPWAALNHPKALRNWQVSDANEQTWVEARADARGVLNLHQAFPRAGAPSVAFAKTVLRADAAGKRKAWVTYTDRFQLFCNGKLVFEGKPRGWFDPDREKLGNSRLVPDQFEVELPLEKGENVIRVRSEATEPFGWGFWMRTE